MAERIGMHVGRLHNTCASVTGERLYNVLGCSTSIRGGFFAAYRIRITKVTMQVASDRKRYHIGLAGRQVYRM